MRTVSCPKCGKPALFEKENPSRPFCSERCKLIDLGQWANEEFRVPSEQHSPQSENHEQNSEEEYDA